MKTVKLLALVLGLSLVYVSCTKEGPAGPAGTNGTNGANGATGPMGNANVKDTTISLTAASWTAYTKYYYDLVTLPQITTSFLATGEVLVYFSGDGGVQWDPCPFTTSNPSVYYLTFYVNGGSNQLGLYFAPAANPNTTLGVTTLQFRVVFITNQAMKRHPNTNWYNMNEVNTVIAQERN